MFVIIGIMFAGVLCGWLLRRKPWLNCAASRLTMPLIFLLLFVMGVGVGGNGNVMDNLAGLGGKALLITLGAVAGSLVAGKLVYRFFFRDGGAVSGEGGDVEDKGAVPCGNGHAESADGKGGRE